MPTKRRMVIFLVVLSVMLLAKYMWGQDTSESVGWDPQHVCFGGEDPESYILMVLVWGPFFGMVTGLGKAWNRHLAAKSGRLFQVEIVLLGL
jgi:hypothetical protein